MRHRREPKPPFRPTSSPTPAMQKPPRSGFTTPMTPNPHPPAWKVLSHHCSLCLSALSCHAHVADSISREQHSTSCHQQSTWIVLCMLRQLILTYKYCLWQAAAQIARCHLKAATPQSLASYSAVSALSNWDVSVRAPKQGRAAMRLCLRQVMFSLTP